MQAKNSGTWSSTWRSSEQPRQEIIVRVQLLFVLSARLAGHYHIPLVAAHFDFPYKSAHFQFLALRVLFARERSVKADFLATLHRGISSPGASGASGAIVLALRSSQSGQTSCPVTLSVRSLKVFPHCLQRNVT